MYIRSDAPPCKAFQRDVSSIGTCIQGSGFLSSLSLSSDASITKTHGEGHMELGDNGAEPQLRYARGTVAPQPMQSDHMVSSLTSLHVTAAAATQKLTIHVGTLEDPRLSHPSGYGAEPNAYWLRRSSISPSLRSRVIREVEAFVACIKGMHLAFRLNQLLQLGEFSLRHLHGVIAVGDRRHCHIAGNGANLQTVARCV